MASNLRRTDDLQRLKTRELVLQGTDGTYPTQGGIPYISNATGLVAVSEGATVDSAGNMITDTLVVGNQDNIGNSLEVNGNASVLGPGTSRGILTTDYLDLVSHDVPNLSTAMLVQNNSLYWRNVAGQMQDVFGAAKQLVPDVPLMELNAAAALPVVIAQLNALTKALSDHHVCVIYTPLTTVIMPFQTPQAVLFATYPTSDPTMVNSVTIPFGVNITPGLALDSIVLALDSVFTSNGMPLSASVSGGTVTLTPSAGYKFLWKDGGSPGSGYRFSSHIGFDGYNAYEPYSTAISGTALVNPIVQPAIPSAPAAPTLVGAATPTSITVSVAPGSSGQAAILYLNGKPVLAIGITTPWQYTFTGLTPNTTYSISASYANNYDEGPVGPALNVPTAPLNPIALNVFDPAYAQYVTATPYTGAPVNNVYIPVLKVTPGFWPAALTNVSQIKYVSMNFWCQYSQPSSYDSDARLVLNLTQSSATETEIFYAFQNRITVSIDPSSIFNWVGSPDQKPSPGPSLVPNAPEVISDQVLLKDMFGIGGSAGSGVIDKTKVLQFCWFCGYPSTAINNCKVDAFTIYYL